MTLLTDWNKNKLVEKITCIISTWERRKSDGFSWWRLKFSDWNSFTNVSHAMVLWSEETPLSLQASKRDSVWTVSLCCNSCLEYGYTPIVWIYIVICIDLPYMSESFHRRPVEIAFNLLTAFRFHTRFWSRRPNR